MNNNDMNGRSPRQIDFTNDPEPVRERPVARGLRDEDWSDDEFTTPEPRRAAPQYSVAAYDGGADAVTDQRQVYAGDYQTNAGAPAGQNPYYPSASGASGGGGMNRYPGMDEEPEKPKGFFKKHPILSNFLIICVTAVVLGWLAMVFLDFWTFHGQERVVPDVKGVELYAAYNNVEHNDLNPIVTDSIYDSNLRPGTVVEQVPEAGARIKKGGAVYLTIVAFTPKMVTVPDFYNISARQARSLFEGLGLSNIREDSVLSEYEGLVLGARYNGVSLRPGARIPISAIVTLEIGTGLSQFENEQGEIIDSAAIEKAVQQIEPLDIE